MPAVVATQPAEVAAPEPAATASASAAAARASAAPTAGPTAEPAQDDPGIQSPSVVQTAVTAATGSPLGVQLLTVVILLAAGFVYFRALGSRGRVTPKAGE